MNQSSTSPILESVVVPSRSPSHEVRVDPEWSTRSSGPSPENRLLVAIVRRAVWDFVLYRDANPKCDKDKYNMACDAAGWIFWEGEEDLDDEGRYSFAYICGELGLHPTQVRAGVLRLKRSDIQKLNNHIKER